jgi:hypothetical protein
MEIKSRPDSDLSYIGTFGARWQSWSIYVNNKIPYNQVIGRFAPWIVIFVQAWFFS